MAMFADKVDKESGKGIVPIVRIVRKNPDCTQKLINNNDLHLVRNDIGS